ncbi:MAG: nitronate monooxygenase [Cyclobacteriaceae bacterium]|nr:nitronate monooxygenase [Cyclobacteriaceae bacterium]
MPEIKTTLTKLLGIRYPIILAPMFLVSNVHMIIEATKAGITGAIPALNYRTDREFRKALEELKEKSNGPFGINLIANKSNIKLKEQLRSCLDYKVDYLITSLGNPSQIIQKCHKNGILVFCDVVDEVYGKKVSDLKPNGLIAVNKEAGGHAGKLSSKELINRLQSVSDLPIISAGGVGNGKQLLEKLDEGACGISMGSPFIATEESPVSQDYKEACIHYSAKDIVMTTKLSGSPCTVINTPYVQKTGTRQSMLEAFLNKQRRFKKLAKMLTFYKGMKSLKKAAFSSTYQSVWCAGPSIEYVKEILPVKKVVENLLREYGKAIGLIVN